MLHALLGTGLRNAIDFLPLMRHMDVNSLCRRDVGLAFLLEHFGYMRSSLLLHRNRHISNFFNLLALDVFPWDSDRTVNHFLPLLRHMDVGPLFDLDMVAALLLDNSGHLNDFLLRRGNGNVSDPFNSLVLHASPWVNFRHVNSFFMLHRHGHVGDLFN